MFSKTDHPFADRRFLQGCKDGLPERAIPNESARFTVFALKMQAIEGAFASFLGVFRLYFRKPSIEQYQCVCGSGP